MLSTLQLYSTLIFHFPIHVTGTAKIKSRPQEGKTFLQVHLSSSVLEKEEEEDEGEDEDEDECKC